MEIKPGMLAHNVLRVNGKASAEACDEPLMPAVLVDIHPDRASLRGSPAYLLPGSLSQA